MNDVPKIMLPDSRPIPQVGLGLWKVKDDQSFITAFNSAYDAGYRHFDTAQAYNNEHLLGKAIKDKGVKREDIFITTKILITHFSPKKVNESFNESLKKLNTDYVDLLLLHFPVPIMRKKAWLELEVLQKANRARSIGVSNYTIRHLNEMQHYGSVKPAINQVELNVFLQQPDLLEYCKQESIQVEAYSPLAHAHLQDNPVIVGLATKYGKSYAQIMLRWLIQKGLVVIPKSVTPSRIQENISLFDFSLSNEDMNELAKLDMNKRFCWSPERIP
jgi:diketogulonate reductase-like aldo/keto reductase